MTTWVNQHDAVKLLLITLVMIPVMGLAIATSNGLEPFVYIVLAGMALCGAAAYWLGNWKWILIPVLAMLVEIAWAIPAVLRDPDAMETPLSIVLESPFWSGLPALIGAGVGYLIKRANP
jgi:hypothetical protein